MHIKKNGSDKKKNIMGRNLKREREWAKTKYTRILADIDKNLGDELKKELKKKNVSIARWVSDNAKTYLKKI